MTGQLSAHEVIFGERFALCSHPMWQRSTRSTNHGPKCFAIKIWKKNKQTLVYSLDKSEGTSPNKSFNELNFFERKEGCIFSSITNSIVSSGMI
jgi:hypothetical protein